MPQNFIQDVLCIFLFFTYLLFKLYFNIIDVLHMRSIQYYNYKLSLYNCWFIVCWFSRSNMTSTCDTNREAHTTQINFNSSHQATVTL